MKIFVLICCFACMGAWGESMDVPAVPIKLEGGVPEVTVKTSCWDIATFIVGIAGIVVTLAMAIAAFLAVKVSKKSVLQVEESRKNDNIRTFVLYWAERINSEKHCEIVDVISRFRQYRLNNKDRFENHVNYKQFMYFPFQRKNEQDAPPLFPKFANYLSTLFLTFRYPCLMEYFVAFFLETRTLIETKRALAIDKSTFIDIFPTTLMICFLELKFHAEKLNLDQEGSIVAALQQELFWSEMQENMEEIEAKSRTDQSGK